MARKVELITEAQWALIAPLLPEPKASAKGGRKPIANRACFEGILWVLRSGASWRAMPAEYGKWEAAYRRYRLWRDTGLWQRILETLPEMGGEVSL